MAYILSNCDFVTYQSVAKNFLNLYTCFLANAAYDIGMWNSGDNDLKNEKEVVPESRKCYWSVH